MEKDMSHDQNLKKLNDLEEKLSKYHNDRDLTDQIISLKNKIEIKAINEAKGAQIRSRVKWIEEGEKCNKYFLSLEKSNAMNNTLCRVKNEEGLMVTKEKEILSVISRYYTNLYAETKNDENIQTNSDTFVKN